MLALTVPIAVSIAFFDFGSMIVNVCTAAVTLPLIFVALNLAARLAATLATRSLRTVGHGFDVDRYLAQLSQPRRHARLVVIVRFADRWHDTEQQPAIEAARATVHDVSARFESAGRVLRFESAELTTTDSVVDHSAPVHFFTNRPVHDCFMQIVRKVVPAVGATHAIQKLEVEIDGTLAAPGEQP